MKFKKHQEIIDNSVNDLLEEIYNDSGNKSEIDYWDPYSNMILESIQLRDKYKLTQAELAKKMNTTQSVISRFENMGRIPSYDFIARLSIALNNKPGMTLSGDYMAVVPLEKQSLIKELADKENISTKKYVQAILDQEITLRRNICEDTQRRDANTTLETMLNFDFTEDDVIPLQRNKTSESYPPKVTPALATPEQGSEFFLAS